MMRSFMDRPTAPILPRGLDLTPNESLDLYSGNRAERMQHVQETLSKGAQYLSRLSGQFLELDSAHYTTQAQHGLGARWARCLLPYCTVTCLGNAPSRIGGRTGVLTPLPKKVLEHNSAKICWGSVSGGRRVPHVTS